VDAVALISPAIQLAAIMAANERRFDVTCPWTEPSLEGSAQKSCGLRDCGRGVGVLVIGLSSTESWIALRREPRQEGVTTCE
jgi:hypothetical protein